MKDEAFQTERLARIFLEQGDTRRAAEIFTRVLEREPENLAAREGLWRCRLLLGRGEKEMQERRLAVLKLLLSRLRGEPVESAAALNPRQRRLQVLQQLLGKVVAWNASRAGRPK